MALQVGFFLFFFKDSLTIWDCCVHRAGLELTEMPLSLLPEACATILSQFFFFLNQLGNGLLVRETVMGP